MRVSPHQDDETADAEADDDGQDDVDEPEAALEPARCRPGPGSDPAEPRGRLGRRLAFARHNVGHVSSAIRSISGFFNLQLSSRPTSSSP